MASSPVTADVVVIGAGCAGLSAAVTLAAVGRRVIVAEAAPRLGGRATAFIDRESGERVDNGQHVMFGCYRDTFAFLERIGASANAPLEARLALTMIDREARAFDLVCPAWPPPWHLIGGVARWRALSWTDRLSAVRLAGVIQSARTKGAAVVAGRVDERQTVSEWLAAHGQSANLCRWLWRPLAVAALNQSPDIAMARPFVRVVGELFGPRVADSAIALPRVPLDELFGTPSQRYLEARGSEVRLKALARVVLDARGQIAAVRIGDDEVETRVVVSAVPWHAVGKIWAGAAPSALSEVMAGAEALESVPIVTANLWFDRPVLRAPFVGLVDGTMQWAFDKSAIFGAGAGHVSMVSSGAIDILRAENDQVTAIAVRDLNAAVPEARAATLRRSVIVREPRATFSLAPGGARRPPARTPLAGFYLAGDWTATDLPATIEGAVLSGRTAAEFVLADLAGLT